jgi:hypothetical protein
MEGLRRRWLGLTVILDVGLRCFGCVMRCVMMVAMRQMGMVCGRLVFACFVVSGCFFVVACCVFVMFCGLMMMICCLL